MYLRTIAKAIETRELEAKRIEAERIEAKERRLETREQVEALVDVIVANASDNTQKPKVSAAVEELTNKFPNEARFVLWGTRLNPLIDTTKQESRTTLR